MENLNLLNNMSTKSEKCKCKYSFTCRHCLNLSVNSYFYTPSTKSKTPFLDYCIEKNKLKKILTKHKNTPILKSLEKTLLQFMIHGKTGKLKRENQFPLMETIFFPMQQKLFHMMKE